MFEKMIIFRKKGFTLSEVLITLTIVGVVAVMTISTLVQHYREKAIVTQVAKTYSMLNEAFARAISDYGTVDNWCSIKTNPDDYTLCGTEMRNILSKYLKVIKICTNGNNVVECTNGGFAYSSAQGEKNKIIKRGTGFYYTSMRLSNGMGIIFDARNYGNMTSYWCLFNTNSPAVDKSCGKIYVDINGNKGPNRDGIDLFGFTIFRNGLIGNGVKETTIDGMSFKNNCLQPMTNNEAIGSCTAWVLQNKNLDYLHCPEKLGWDKQKSCK